MVNCKAGKLKNNWNGVPKGSACYNTLVWKACAQSELVGIGRVKSVMRVAG